MNPKAWLKTRICTFGVTTILNMSEGTHPNHSPGIGVSQVKLLDVGTISD